MCLHTSVFVSTMQRVSISQLPTGTLQSQPHSPSMLCYRQEAIYNNQLISQQVVPDSQQLLHWQTQILPPHCRRGGGIRLFLVPFIDMCCRGSRSPSVTERWKADMCYHKAGLPCEQCDPERGLDMC